MANPGGNYPGRQIFLGRIGGQPAFAYFVSGRSPPSQNIYASWSHAEGAIRIKPLDTKEPFDPFRHYQAVRITPEGLLVVSNSQAPNDALVEAYTHMDETDKRTSMFLADLLGVLGPEYDNPKKPTPRIVGVISPTKDSDWDFRLGIATKKYAANSASLEPADGEFAFVQTYDGKVNYSSFDPSALFNENNLFKSSAPDAERLLHEIYEMSDYVDPTYGELRVCAIAGVRTGWHAVPGGWDIRSRNRQQSPRTEWERGMKRD